METKKISVQLLNAIIGYLAKRPYEETYQLIQSLQNEAANQPEPDKPTE